MGCVWLGMLQVSIGPNCTLDFIDGAGAFVWFATQADCEETFIKKVGGVVESYGLVLIESSHVGPVEDVMELSEEHFDMATRAERSPEYCIYGTFDTYPFHEA